LEPGEECDDGNIKDGDGCDGNCKKENPINTKVVYRNYGSISVIS